MLNTVAMKKQAVAPKKNVQKREDKQEINKTLEGVLINNHVKNDTKTMSIDQICDSLMITQTSPVIKNNQDDNKKKTFDYKKAILPLVVGVGTAFGGAAVISLVLKKSSKAILKNYCEQLPPIAHNMNIPEEPHLAVYEMIRNPNPKNIIAAGAVFLFSALTLSAKSFVDGVKEIWIKKREADIERDLQENLITVEASAFSGKLQSVNSMLKENADYFKKVFNELTPEQKAKNLFGSYFGFKGSSNNVKKDNQSTNLNEDVKKDNKKKAYLALGGALFLASCALLGKFTFSNMRKACQEMDDFAKNTVKEGIKEGKIFSDASSGLSGDAGLISFYSYLNEPRGHLYNWVLNPTNKFLKNIFVSFSAVSAVGYVFKQGMDAFKTVNVARENSKTELDLKKRLVEVEIENFKAKKNSAIQPLRDEFDRKLNSKQKTSEELRDFAENILCEIKNGPPYVYS
ncbi:MAG: hypothetical protein E7Z91_05155 [Cyanobacteria bacterium SIG30]|nr:hypothetical protein [Cyanobacteria bacterium SIG30]